MGWKTWMIWGKSQTDEQMFQLRWLRTLNQKLDDEDWGTGKKGWEGNSHVHSLVNRDVARTTANGNSQIGALVGQILPKNYLAGCDLQSASSLASLATEQKLHFQGRWWVCSKHCVLVVLKKIPHAPMMCSTSDHFSRV